MKSYVVRFFSGASNSVDHPDGVSALLASIHGRMASGAALQWLDGGVTYELRDFVQLNNGTVYRGVLATMRDDAPHIREAAGTERPIALDVDEHLIEKNYFLYFATNELLVWQVNGRGSHLTRFERYLTHFAKHTITLSDIVAASALERLQQGTIKRLEVRLARPRNAALLAPDDWSSRAFGLMTDSDAGSISISVGTRRRDAGLAPRMREAVHHMLNMSETRALRVKLSGNEELIDLMAERLRADIEVAMNGLYPDSTSIYAELQRAKDRKQPDLDQFFGVDGHVLD